MAAIKYKVKLAESERTRLNEVSHRGKPPVRTVKRALALLKADEGIRDGEIAGALLINAATVARVRKRFVEEGLEAAINDKPRPGRERKLDGKQEAHLAAIACSSPPEGHVNWTLHLLADKVVELEFAGSVRWCVSTRPPSSCSGMCGLPLRPPPDGWSAMTLSTSETGPGICSCSVNRRVGGGTSR